MAMLPGHDPRNLPTPEPASRIRVSLADAGRPRFGFTAGAWERIVQLAIAYQAGGYDWTDRQEPAPDAPARWRFMRFLVETGRVRE